MTMRLIAAAAAGLLLLSLTGCFGGEVRETCNDPEAYQSAPRGERIKVPDDLDDLDEFKEMPMPKAETPPRPAGAGCLESPPSILSGT